MSLRTFNPKAFCPKCRSNDIGTLFCKSIEGSWMADSWNGGGKGHNYRCDCTSYQFHFHRNCHRCEYEWFEGVELTDEDRKKEIIFIETRISRLKSMKSHLRWGISEISIGYYIEGYKKRLGELRGNDK